MYFRMQNMFATQTETLPWVGKWREGIDYLSCVEDISIYCSRSFVLYGRVGSTRERWSQGIGDVIESRVFSRKHFGF